MNMFEQLLQLLIDLVAVPHWSPLGDLADIGLRAIRIARREGC